MSKYKCNIVIYKYTNIKLKHANTRADLGLLVNQPHTNVSSIDMYNNDVGQESAQNS